MLATHKIPNKETNEIENNRKWLWVPCPTELYKPAYILEETTTHVKTRSNVVETFKQSEVFKMNPSKFDLVEDLAGLSNLNEPSVLHTLKRRYEQSDIYSYSGLFLISLNPYKSINIYAPDVMREIALKKPREAGPHIFSVANEAYRCLLTNGTNQSILITGESGAGKTENTKRVVEFLSMTAASGLSGGGVIESKINTLLLSANPILEAFGNARTVKNDNSSRFGKFIQLKFKAGAICGARIEKYLLEKSRVTHQSPGERSFHVFYYLLKGAPDSLLEALGLVRDSAVYRCLGGSCEEDDVREFEQLAECFDCLGIPDPGRYYRTVAAILHLGNIDFIESEDCVYVKDIANIDNGNMKNEITDPTDKTGPNKNASNMKSTEEACRLLNIPLTDFLREVLHPSFQAGSETVVHSRTRLDCLKVVEGLMKMLYDTLFDALVFDINRILDSPHSDSFIGVLDIAGFEIFQKNSFEQLCINYTNEKLQQFFNHHMFILEQEIYRNESIDWNFIDFGLDLEPTIRLIEGNNPIGILSYLDEECVMPKASDHTLLAKIRSIKGVEGSLLTDSFKIKHYAGVVKYEVCEWLDKNKDVHSESLHRLAGSHSTAGSNSPGSSEESFLKKGIFRTVSQSHRENLRRLMDLLRTTNPHFVRCILPNLKKSSNEFDRRLVLDQLRCNGVLEGIRIARLGYPSRITFKDFNERYEILLGGNCDLLNNPTDKKNNGSDSDLLLIPRNLTIGILNSTEINQIDYKIGNTMVFLRQGILADLEDLRDGYISRLSKVVTGILHHKAQERKRNIESERKKTILLIQKNAHMSYDLLRWRWWALFQKIKPLLEAQKSNESLKEKEEQIKTYAVLVEREREEKKRLEESVTELNAILSESRKEVELSRVALEEKENLLAGLRRENGGLQASKAQMDKMVDSLVERVQQGEVKEENHAAAMQALDTALEEAKRELKNHEEAVNRLVQKGGDLAAVLRDREEKVDNLTTQLAAAEKAINSEQEDNGVLRTESIALRETIKILEEKIDCREGAIQKARSELDDRELENEALQGSLRKLQHALGEETRQVTNLRQEAEYFKEKTATLEETLVLSRERVRVLEGMVEELKQNKTGTHEIAKQVKILTLRVSNLEEINKEITAEKEELSVENERLAKEKIEALCTADRQINQEKKALQLEIHKLQMENNRLKAEIAGCSTSHDEGTEALLEKVGQDLENERTARRQQEKEKNAIEMKCTLLENKIRELVQQVEEKEEESSRLVQECTKNFVPKEEVHKMKQTVERIRGEINNISDLFMQKFLQIFTEKDFYEEKLVEKLGEAEGLLASIRLENETLKKGESDRVALQTELDELLRKNSLLKAEIDTLTVSITSGSLQVEELKKHIEKMQDAFNQREGSLESIKSEYTRRIKEAIEREEEARKLLNEYRETIQTRIGRMDEELSAKAIEAVRPYAERVETLVRELGEADRRVVEKDLEIARLSQLLEVANELINRNISFSSLPSNFIDNSVPIEKERLVSSFVVDKEALKAIERKKLLKCNCEFMSRVKVVEITRENKEEAVKLANENNVLNLKLKQAERMIKEQNGLIESMKGTIIVLKKK